MNWFSVHCDSSNNGSRCPAVASNGAIIGWNVRVREWNVWPQRQRRASDQHGSPVGAHAVGVGVKQGSVFIVGPGISCRINLCHGGRGAMGIPKVMRHERFIE